jgi:hypothetical protein
MMHIADDSLRQLPWLWIFSSVSCTNQNKDMVENRFSIVITWAELGSMTHGRTDACMHGRAMIELVNSSSLKFGIELSLFPGQQDYGTVNWSQVSTESPGTAGAVLSLLDTESPSLTFPDTDPPFPSLTLTSQTLILPSITLTLPSLTDHRYCPTHPGHCSAHPGHFPAHPGHCPEDKKNIPGRSSYRSCGAPSRSISEMESSLDSQLGTCSKK